MKGSKLRIFILDVLSKGNKYTQSELKDCMQNHFGESCYTEKQLRDLLYNLRRAKKIYKNSQGQYSIAISKPIIEPTKNTDLLEIAITPVINEFVQKSQILCSSFISTIDAPNLMQRIQKSQYNLSEIEKLYAAAESLLSTINDFK